MLTKVCRQNFFSDNELHIRSVIMDIPDYKDHFLLVSKVSDIILSNSNPLIDDDVGNIDIYNNLKHCLFEYKDDGGQLCATNNIDFFIYHTFTTFKFILESLSKLIDAEVLHLNIDNELFCC